MPISSRILNYFFLMRLDKPIGILLLLWPTLWAVWLASEGRPSPGILFIFMTGTVLMRSAGCICNDLADRHIDGHVTRTANRPLVTGRVSVKEALGLVCVLLFLSFLLVFPCNRLTILLAFIGAGLAFFYPLLKRITHLPQLGLGAAFSWGVPMAFAAETGGLTFSAIFLFLTAMVWPLIYDTMYAMVDKSDDIKIGVKSTAILFYPHELFIIACLQSTFVGLLVLNGLLFHLHSIYYFCLIVVSMLFLYQQLLIKNRNASQCFRAFIHNQWVGFIIFLGIFLSFYL